MMSDTYWKEKYDDLRYYYDKRGDKINKLEKENRKLYDNFSSAEFRIRNELEPKIQSERKSYDNYVSNGGGDMCFQIGMSGNCGYKCPNFGDKSECFEDMKDEDFLYAYENYINDGIILDYIEDLGLSEKAKEIDIKLLKQRINSKQLELDKLNEELNKMMMK